MTEVQSQQLYFGSHEFSRRCRTRLRPVPAPPATFDASLAEADRFSNRSAVKCQLKMLSGVLAPVAVTLNTLTPSAVPRVLVPGLAVLSAPVVACVAASVPASRARIPSSRPGTVVARNASVTFAFAPVNHNVTFRTVAGAPTSIATSIGTRVVRAFASSGDFRDGCSLHAGMTGMVMVR